MLDFNVFFDTQSEMSAKIPILDSLNPCQDGLWRLFLVEMSKYKRAFAWFCPKIGATECPLSAGGGSNGFLGNAQMNCYIFMVGLP